VWEQANFWVGRNFAQISRNLPKKYPKKQQLHFTGRKALQARFLPKFNSRLPKFLVANFVK